MQLKHWRGKHTDDSGHLLPEFIAAMKRDPLIRAEWEKIHYGSCLRDTEDALVTEVVRLRASNEECVHIVGRVMKEMERIVHVVNSDGRFADLKAGMDAALHAPPAGSLQEALGVSVERAAEIIRAWFRKKPYYEKLAQKWKMTPLVSAISFVDTVTTCQVYRPPGGHSLLVLPSELENPKNFKGPYKVINFDLTRRSAA